MIRAIRWVATGVLVVVIGLITLPALAVPFTVQYLDGGTWNALFAQGFKASVGPTPDPGHAITDTVSLDRFQFYKSGATTYDSGGGVLLPLPPSQNFQLAIVNNFFVNLQTLTTSSTAFVGLSTNTITDAASYAVNDPIVFNFNHLPLLYGANTQDDEFSNNYAAIFVTNNGGTLTPLRVPAISCDYIAANEIESDYGVPGDYLLSASNFMHTNSFGTFLDSFNATASSLHGDANFIAYFDQPAGPVGDYNGDTIVNAADYTIWRDTFGSTTDLRANGDNNSPSNNKIDDADFNIWKTNFGMHSGSGGLGPTGGSVPEPSTVVMAALAGLLCSCLRIRRVRI